MKVLLISNTYMIKVNQKKLDELASISGVELQVVVSKSWKEAIHKNIVVDPPINPNYSFHSFPSFFNGYPGKSIYRTLDLTMRKFKPDIIHTESGTRGFTTFQSVTYRRIFAPKSKFIAFTWANLEAPIIPPLQYFERINLSQTDHVICGNVGAKELLISKGYSRPISVIPQLGIDTDFFIPSNGNRLRGELNISPDTFVIGFAGRMSPEKGLLFLIEAAAYLTGDWALILIGRGPDRDIAFRRAQTLGIAEHIRWIDVVPHLELVNYYNIMNVLVSTSITTPIWKEQFGLVVAQAMACQVPVIGSVCGETPNVIGDAGLLFHEGDIVTLSEHLKHLQADPRFCADLGKKGAKRIKEHYTFHSIAQQTYKVWESLRDE